MHSKLKVVFSCLPCRCHFLFQCTYSLLFFISDDRPWTSWTSFNQLGTLLHESRDTLYM